MSALSKLGEPQCSGVTFVPEVTAGFAFKFLLSGRKRDFTFSHKQ